ncbi:Anp1-domain-containing protein [Kalaharituber pfeilii]|nr:Anp1-domain-containing protein [Kalaharituber pfeilii]
MVSRSLRRSNPIMLVLTLMLVLGFMLFILTPDKSDIAPKKTVPPTKNRKPPPVLRYHMNGLKATKDPVGNKEKVIILTPLARFYDEYWQNLLKLTYPRELTELGFIIPKGREGNLALSKLQDAVHKVQTGKKKEQFAKVTILRQDFDSPISQNEKDRHELSAQKSRRAAMSRARNSLLFSVLRPDISWVLWLDGDIVETPPTLIQDLASHDKALIVPNCYQRYKEKGVSKIRPYDYNSWHDSKEALKLAETMGKDEILLEGYHEMATYRYLMTAEYDPKGDKHAETPLDGVGGTALLVKAEVHRDGAMFPPFPFYHLIESEGFAKMARRLGYQPYGLPNYLIYHYNE